MSSLKRIDNRRNVIFYFQVHQPRRLRQMRFFDIGSSASYFNDSLNRDVIHRVSKSCYLPANEILLKLIEKYPDIRVAFSITGTALDQFQEYSPEVIESFRQLSATGSVEFLAETYYHSLACVADNQEFEIQTLKHLEVMENLFGQRPTVFRNTELIYNNDVGKRVAGLGFAGIYSDGVDRILGNSKTAHQIYCHPEEKDLKILLRNHLLSDDIAFRFSHLGNTLTAETYVSWLSDIPVFEKVVNVAIDYETFGEHQKKETGIFTFFRRLLAALGRSRQHRMMTPSEAIATIAPAGELSVPGYVSWADRERDLSAWLGNEMQRDAFSSVQKLEKQVKATGNPQVLKLWRMLQTSDHFYYMSTKRGTDAAVHNYFSPFASPYEAFINYMNVLTDFSLCVRDKKPSRKRPAPSGDSGIAERAPLMVP